MSLLPDDASFHEKVEAAFVLYRGSGVSLSPADVDLVNAWAELDVPFEVVARGLRKAAEAALWDAAQGQGRLRSLAGARRQVELEIGKYLRAAPAARQPAAPPVPFHVQRWKKLLARLRAVGEERPSLLPVLAHLTSLPPPDDFPASSRREELALALIARTLPFAERLSIARAARQHTVAAAPASRSARQESFRFHRTAMIRQHVGLPSFW